MPLLVDWILSALVLLSAVCRRLHLTSSAGLCVHAAVFLSWPRPQTRICQRTQCCVGTASQTALCGPSHYGKFTKEKKTRFKLIYLFFSSTNLSIVFYFSVVASFWIQHADVVSVLQSMPSIEEDTKLTSLEADGSSSGSSGSFRDVEVSISALLKVICHKDAKMTNNTPLHTELLSQEKHKEVCAKIQTLCLAKYMNKWCE